MTERVHDEVAKIVDELRRKQPEEHLDEWEQAEEKKRQQLRQRAWLETGVPRRVRDVLARATDTDAVCCVRRWLEQRERDDSQWLLVLSAHKGVGKSVAAGLWLRELDWHHPRYRNQAGEEVKLPSWWSISKFSRMDGYSGAFDTLCSHPGPLVIDDLGSEYLDHNGWFLQALDAFIDARYGEYRPTMLTTNLAADEFKKRYSERVVDRVREGGSFQQLRGASMRQQLRAV
jgi:hypothetical protein